MTKRITFSAICLALTVIFLYAASAFSTGRIAALGLASLLCCICVSQFGVRYGIALYVGASMLALLLLPSKMFALIYVLFAGYYPIIKFFVEKLRKLWAEWILKILFFNLVAFLLYLIVRLFFAPVLESAPVLLVLQYLGPAILILQVVFIIYDWMLSYMIGYYNQFIRRISHD